MAPKAKQKEKERTEEDQAAHDQHEGIIQKAVASGVRHHQLISQHLTDLKHISSRASLLPTPPSCAE